MTAGLRLQKVAPCTCGSGLPSRRTPAGALSCASCRGIRRAGTWRPVHERDCSRIPAQRTQARRTLEQLREALDALA